MLMTLEMGKPLAQSKGEVTYGNEFFRWFSEEAVRIHGPLVRSRPTGTLAPDDDEAAGRPDADDHAVELPAGDGHPQDRPGDRRRLHDGGQARLADPADDAARWRRCSRRSGCPKGVLNVVPTSRTSDVMEPLISDPRLRKLTFTGSTAGRQEAGRAVRRAAAAGLDGARRQRAVPGLRRRRPRRRRRGRDARQDAQHGRGLHRGQPLPGPRGRRRRVRRDARASAWPPRRSAAAPRTASPSDRSSTSQALDKVSELVEDATSARRLRSSPAARAPARRATSSSPPCSPTCPPTPT